MEVRGWGRPQEEGKQCAAWMCTYPLGIGQWGKRGYKLFCPRAEDETKGLDLGERRENKGLRLPTCLLGRCGFPSGWLWELELRQRSTVIIDRVFCTLAFSVFFSLCLVWIVFFAFFQDWLITVLPGPVRLLSTDSLILRFAFDYQNPHEGGRRALTQQSWPLCTYYDTCTHMHTSYMHNN